MRLMKIVAAFLALLSLCGCASDSREEKHLEDAGTSPVLNYVVYCKDGQKFYVDLHDRKPIRIGNIENDYFFQSNYEVSKDQSAIVYWDMNEDTVWWQSLKNPKDTVQISSEGTAFHLSSCGRYVTCWGKSKGLYQFDAKEKTYIQIAENISDFWVSVDGKQVYYEIGTDQEHWASADEIPDEYGYYWWRADGGSEQLLRENQVYFTSILTNISRNDFEISPDVSTAVYCVDGNLYRKHYGEEAELIAEDVEYLELQNYKILSSNYSLNYDTVYYRNHSYDLCRIDEDGKIQKVQDIEFPYKELVQRTTPSYSEEWDGITYENSVHTDEFALTEADLYLNREFVDTQVIESTVWQNFNVRAKDGAVVYFKDYYFGGKDREIYTGKKESASMYLYRGGKTEKIAEKVALYYWMPDGRILYTTCGFAPEEKLDLYIFDGEKSYLLVEECDFFSYNHFIKLGGDPYGRTAGMYCDLEDID